MPDRSPKRLGCCARMGGVAVHSIHGFHGHLVGPGREARAAGVRVRHPILMRLCDDVPFKEVPLKPKPSDILKANSYCLEIYESGRETLAEAERLALVAGLIEERRSSIPFFRQRAEADPDYWSKSAPTVANGFAGADTSQPARRCVYGGITRPAELCPMPRRRKAFSGSTN